MMMKETIPSYQNQILDIGRRMWQSGMVASNDGNISYRLGPDRYIITAAGISKGFMNSDQHLIIIDDQGKVIQGSTSPSSEYRLHLHIYHQRPDINAICHAHPPYATAFALTEIQLPDHILPEVILTIGAVPLIPYGTTGTEEIYRHLGEYLPDHQAFLLARHGAVTLGNNLMEAYYRLETLEHYAHILLIARQLGPIPELTPHQLESLKARLISPH